MNLKLSRRELDELRNIYGRDPDLRDLLDHVATLERENASLRKAYDCLRTIAAEYDIREFLEGYEVEL